MKLVRTRNEAIQSIAYTAAISIFLLTGTNASVVHANQCH